MDFVPWLAIALVSVIFGSVALLALAFVQAAAQADRDFLAAAAAAFRTDTNHSVQPR